MLMSRHPTRRPMKQRHTSARHLLNDTPVAFGRRVFFRRISNDSLIVDLVNVALSSDGPAVVLVRRPREQPGARPATVGETDETKRVQSWERRRGNAPVWHCHVFRAASYNNARLFVAYTSPLFSTPLTSAVQHPVCPYFRDGIFLLGQSI